MAQLNLYLDDSTMKRIKLAAKRECTSISKWVAFRLEITMAQNWPKGYFDLFGALAKDKLVRPSQGKYSQDFRQASL